METQNDDLLYYIIRHKKTGKYVWDDHGHADFSLVDNCYLAKVFSYYEKEYRGIEDISSRMLHYGTLNIHDKEFTGGQYVDFPFDDFELINITININSITSLDPKINKLKK